MLSLSIFCSQLDQNEENEIDSAIFLALMNIDTKVKEEDMGYEGHGNDSDEALVLAIGPEIEATTEDVFQGLCVNSEAQLTVVRFHQAKIYCREFGGQTKPQKLKQVYLLGSKHHSSIGTLKIRIPFSKTHVVDITADVVDLNVLLLLRLEVLTKFKVLFGTENDVLTSLSTN